MSFSQTAAASDIKNDSYKYVLYSLCVVRVFCRQRTRIVLIVSWMAGFQVIRIEY